MFYIYILLLTNNKYYVGRSTTPQQRIDTHIDGKGAQWTQLHPPVDILDVIKTDDPFDEDKYTKITMCKYGIDNVRGGSYCQINLSPDQKQLLETELRTAQSECYKCGSPDHFVKKCTPPSPASVQEPTPITTSVLNMYPNIAYGTSDYDRTPLQNAVTKMNNGLTHIKPQTAPSMSPIYTSVRRIHDILDEDTLGYLIHNVDKLRLLFTEVVITDTHHNYESMVRNNKLLMDTKGACILMKDMCVIIVDESYPEHIDKFIVNKTKYYYPSEKLQQSCIRVVGRKPDTYTPKWHSLFDTIVAINMDRYYKYQEFKRNMELYKSLEQ